MRRTCLFLLGALLFAPPAARAQFTYTATNGEVTITGYTGSGGVLAIPNAIAGLPVSSIGDYAFWNCGSLTSVTIPNTVTTIGDGAFEYCGMMTTLMIGNGVTNIGDGAFGYCASLDSVTIPGGVTSIGSEAFGSCNFLFSVFFAGNAPENDGSAFTNNNMVTVYYLFGTSGWSSTYGGRPTVSCPTNLHEFDNVGNDGEHPYAGLALAGSTLYGTTGDGGRFGQGTIFSIHTDGTGYTNLYSFGTVATDGRTPLAGLTLAGSKLYGTTQPSFGSGSGTMFAINTDGTGYTNLYSFGSVADDGEMTGASAGLTLVGSRLYGVAPHGGYYGASELGYGTVFAINTDGTGYTNLYRFGSVANDGVLPFAGTLVLAGSTLYGTTETGLGGSSNGTIFAISMDGTGYTNLYSFGSVANDGATPLAGLTLAGSTLYGTTFYGGAFGAGAIFAINADGGGYTLLASCAGLNAYGGAYENGLTLAGSMLYGTTECGGFGYGTIFALTTNTVKKAIITVQASPTAGGTASGGGTYPVGGNVEIVATANSGWTFSGWSDGGAQTHTITVLAGRATYTAIFTPNSTDYTIAVTASPTAGGKVSGGGTFPAGSLQSVTATAKSGYVFLNWTENGVVVNSSASYTLTLSSNVNLVASFTLNAAKDSIAVGASPPAGGTVSGGGMFAPGSSRTVTAKANGGYVFANWTESGSVVSTLANCAFTLSSNVDLVANFVPNPFIPLHGTFNGLFMDTNDVTEASSGFFTLTLTAKGAFTGKTMTSGNSYSLPATTPFDAGGQVEFTVPTKQGTLTFNLQLSLTGPSSQQITGTVSDGAWTAGLTADRAVFSASTNKALNYEGHYTLAIAGSEDAAASPGGFGCATLSISPAGLITLAGNLADGTAISQSVSVSKDGRWPFHAAYPAAPAGNGGAVLGWLTFSNAPATALGGTLYWFRPAGKTPTVYQSGFTNLMVLAIGSAYNPADKPPLALTNGQVTLDGGNLPLAITNQIILESNGTITVSPPNTDKLALTINKTTGAISGSFANPSNPKQSIKINGVLLQNQTNAVGYFLGTSQSGAIMLVKP